MKIFISSVITGFEPYREAVAEIINKLRHDAIRSEDFPSQPNTPQQSCLREVRESDAVVLLLGARYGYRQDKSGMSATEEEYEEAKKNDIPVLAFIESEASKEPLQEQFINRVKSWGSGQFCKYFSNVSELEKEVLLSLHHIEHDISNNRIDKGNLKRRVELLITNSKGNGHPSLHISLAGRPEIQIIRPATLNQINFQNKVEKYAKSRKFPILDKTEEIRKTIKGGWLTLHQLSAVLSINQEGEIIISQKILSNNGFGLPAIIKERVAEKILGVLEFYLQFLNDLDTDRKLSTLAVAVCISGNRSLSFPWRTEREHKENPNQMTVGDGKIMMPVSLKPFSRSTFERDLDNIRDDLIALIEWDVHHG